MFAIAERLFKTATFQAVIPRMKITYDNLTGGNTAAVVSIATTQSQFVFKADDDAKLLREARVIEELRNDKRLSAFSSRLPQVFAVWADGPPYAYVMEFFDTSQYQSVKQLLFGRGAANVASPARFADTVVSAAVLALREAYLASVDDRQQVRLMSDAYYRRIIDGLSAAATYDDRFASRAIIVNGVAIRPWRTLVEHLATSEARLQRLAAPFVTVVHGDPNPGNILLQHRDGSVIDVKFIDLKDWRYGDYIFDIAKLTHYMMYTGPLEELRIVSSPAVVTAGETTAIEYAMLEPNPFTSAILVIESHAEDIASYLGDEHWRERYRLAIASNVLGLLPGRLRAGAVDDATVLFSAGLLHLEDFVRGGALD